MTLEIVVCIGRVVAIEETLEAERGACSIDEGSLAHALNEADACAIETALKLRDARAGSRVIAFSMGTCLQEEALRYAMAQGADEVVRLWDEAFLGSDCLGTARILAAAAASVKADIVACGELSLDGASGVVGAQLAELLGVPMVDKVAKAEFTVKGDGLLTERRTGGGFRTVESTPLPVLIGVRAGANVPRYPALRAKLDSRSAPIPCWGMVELGLTPAQVGEAGSALRTISLRRPPPDPRGLVDPSSDLPPEERWMMAISGGVRERESALIEGSPDELAERLVRYLEQGRHIQQ